MSAPPIRVFAPAVIVWCCCSLFACSLFAQPKDPLANDPPAKDTAPKIPVIADEPRFVDPATILPARLAQLATVELADSSLTELIDWLRDEQKLVVLTEQTALSDAGVLPGEPVSDRLDNAPLYLLLNRLRSIGVAWFYEDQILRITSVEAAEERMTTLPYNLTDLLDANYTTDDLSEVIQHACSPDSWEDVGGPGVLSFLGDVMIVRQNQRVHHHVRGLLAALRKHARQTFVLEAPQHGELRKTLSEEVSVEFLDTPLNDAVVQLSKQTKIDIRLDMQALRDVRIRERQPVTLKLADRKLETVLQAMLSDFGLTWSIQDGVLQITTPDADDARLKTAVYDVRDLCRDEFESDALLDAITSQAEPDAWEDVGGAGSISFPLPGTLVIAQTGRMHQEILRLLETYRTALRNSRPRDRHEDLLKEVTTVYYRLHSRVAEDLAELLPGLIAPETWKSDAHPKAVGQILRASSAPDITTVQGKLKSADSGDEATAHAVVTARSVLIVTQSRAVHDEISEIIRRVESGDVYNGDNGMGGGMGGSFGGGFFSIPDEHPVRADGKRSPRGDGPR